MRCAACHYGISRRYTPLPRRHGDLCNILAAAKVKMEIISDCRKKKLLIEISHASQKYDTNQHDGLSPLMRHMVADRHDDDDAP